jgi:hypothetical protein
MGDVELPELRRLGFLVDPSAVAPPVESPTSLAN